MSPTPNTLSLGGTQVLPGMPFRQAPGLSSSRFAGLVYRGTRYENYYAYVHSFQPLGAGAIRTPNSFTVDRGFDFYVHQLAVLAQNYGALVQMSQTPTTESWQSIPVYLSHFGTGQQPTRFVPPRRLPRGTIFTMLATDGQAAPATNLITVVYHGLKVYDTPTLTPRWYDDEKEYEYTADYTAQSPFGPLAALETRVQQINIDADSDFDVIAITCVADAAVTIQIQSQPLDNWFLTPIPYETLSGSLIEIPAPPIPFASGAFAFRLPAPHLIGSGSYVNIQLANQVNAVNRAQVVLHGVRLSPAGGYPVTQAELNFYRQIGRRPASHAELTFWSVNGRSPASAQELATFMGGAR